MAAAGIVGAMADGRVAGDGGAPRPRSRRPVLYLNTPTEAMFGADTWIHAEIMRRLDRTEYEPIAACAYGPPDTRTPTYEVLSEIPDLELVPADLGPDLRWKSGVAKARAVVGTARGGWTIARLAWLIRRRGIGVIHTSDRPRDAFAAVVLSRLTPARSLVHVHQAYTPQWFGRLHRWSLAHADDLIAISDFVGRSLVEGGMAPERVHVVRNGIDPDVWHPGARRDTTRASLGIDDATPVLLTICRLFPEKGPADVIEAVARLRGEHPRIQLLVVGTDITEGGWFSTALHERVAELGLGDHVRFLGRRDDIEGLMAAADVYVMPSTGEPFGLVFCEAMAMGLPVVALDDGGTVEVVEHGRTGLLSARGDLDALTEHVRTLLTDPERRRSIGAAGRREVVARLSADRMAADAAALYAAIAFSTPDDRAHAQRGSTSMRVLETTDVDEFRRALDEDGYVVMRDVVRRDGLTELADSLTAEFERKAASDEMFEGGGLLSGHLNCFPGEQSRFVWEDIKAAGVQDLVRAVRPDIADSLRATLNFNLPGSVAQHYHMDGLYLQEFLICNIAVVDTDLRNGAIDVLPGTQRQFLKFWRYALGRWYRRTTRVPLRQGDIVIRKSTLWHRGMPNHSSQPRPMMAITFGEMDELDADPFMVNDGKVVFYPNWYNTNRLGQLREKTFVKAPITYSTWRFIRSLYGNKGYASF